MPAIVISPQLESYFRIPDRGRGKDPSHISSVQPLQWDALASTVMWGCNLQEGLELQCEPGHMIFFPSSRAHSSASSSRLQLTRPEGALLLDTKVCLKWLCMQKYKHIKYRWCNRSKRKASVPVTYFIQLTQSSRNGHRDHPVWMHGELEWVHSQIRPSMSDFHNFACKRQDTAQAVCGISFFTDIVRLVREVSKFPWHWLTLRDLQTWFLLFVSLRFSLFIAMCYNLFWTTIFLKNIFSKLQKVILDIPPFWKQILDGGG